MPSFMTRTIWLERLQCGALAIVNFLHDVQADVE
jgi:hypothetical protein